MPSVLPHRGRREGERAAAGVRGEREMEEEETDRGETKKEKERRTREKKRGGVFNYQTAAVYSMLDEYIVVM